MALRLTAISGAFAGTSREDALEFAFRETCGALGDFSSAGASVFFGGDERSCTGRAVRLTAPETFRENLLAACRRVSADAANVSETLCRAAQDSDALLVGNVDGLSLAEWLPALARARRAVPWIFCDWPREFPACDPVRTAAERGSFPQRLVASACMKFAYKSNFVRRDVLSAVSVAIFASKPLMERNAPSFPLLKEARVVPPPIDAALFRFRHCSPARKNSWGFIGDFAGAPEDVEIALRIFAFEALQNPDCRFRIFGNAASDAGKKIAARVREHPALASRVAFEPPPSGNAELADALRSVGVLVAPRRKSRAFPQLIALAVACGCFPICGRDAETEALLGNLAAETLFDATAPSGAFLLCEKLNALSAERREKLLEPRSREILAAADPATVAGKIL